MFCVVSPGTIVFFMNEIVVLLQLDNYLPTSLLYVFQRITFSTSEYPKNQPNSSNNNLCGPGFDITSADGFSKSRRLDTNFIFQ